MTGGALHGDSRTAPAMWTSWRDVRDGTVVTVVGPPMHWDHRFAVSPRRGQGYVRVEVENARRYRIRSLRQWDFEDNFELIYDPATGWEVAA